MKMRCVCGGNNWLQRCVCDLLYDAFGVIEVFVFL